MTPHIEAKKGDIAEFVIMPGDPLRAKFIAENFLDNIVQYNSIRGMLGYTGYYKGRRISVQGSGMGVPSIGIYAYELYSFYDVQSIVRVGTAGGIASDIKIKDIVIAMGASTNSNFMRQYSLEGIFAPIASYKLLQAAVNYTKAQDIQVSIGNILTSDTFYGDYDEDVMKKWQKMGILAVEMEAAGLYATAARLNKQALAILTISDLVFKEESVSAQERQNSFTQMMNIALEI